MTSDEVRYLGKDPEYVVHAPGDRDAHLAMTTVNHQIHCLATLRRNFFFSRLYPNGSSSLIHWDHLYHCLDLLLQTLQCNANVDLITYNWMEEIDIAQPDFNVKMVCRDWSALKKYQNENELDPWESVGGWKRPEDGNYRNVTLPWQWKTLNEEGRGDD